MTLLYFLIGFIILWIAGIVFLTGYATGYRAKENERKAEIAKLKEWMELNRQQRGAKRYRPGAM